MSWAGRCREHSSQQGCGESKVDGLIVVRIIKIGSLDTSRREISPLDISRSHAALESAQHALRSKFLNIVGLDM